VLSGLSDRDVRRVAAEAGVDPRTARAVLVDGKGCHAGTRALLVAALRALKFATAAKQVEGCASE
jgi:hypothetical protein